MIGSDWERFRAEVDESRIRAGSSARRALTELRALRERLGRLIDAEVIAAREGGMTWDQIGPTRQAAQQLYTYAKKRERNSDK